MKATGEGREEIWVTIDEELDVERARHAEAEMLQQAAGDRRLVLDLSRVPRFNFTGIVVLLDALAKLRHRFGGVSILGLSERIGQVFVALGAEAAGWTCVRHAEGGKGESKMGRTSSALARGRAGRGEPWRGPGAERHAALVADWLKAHRHQIIECGRHNGLARLTLRACAERYRRAAGHWVESLPIHENDKHPLRLSLAVCGGCPTGASSALFHDCLAG